MNTRKEEVGSHRTSTNNPHTQMQIALMTWFQYYNYGTSLQLIAMNHLLSKNGDQVSVVNYHSRPNRQIETRPRMKQLKDRFVAYNNPHYTSERRQDKFLKFYEENLKFTEPCDTLSELEQLNRQFDCFVCGSDQIWNPQVFDVHYFLDYVFDSKRIIAYAPSMSTPTIDNEDIRERIKECVCRIEHLSVREETGSQILSEIIGRKPKVVLDPTLLIPDYEWDKIIENEIVDEDENYILVYMLGNNKSHWKGIYQLQKQLNVPLKIIPVYQYDFRRKGCIEYEVGPKEFVELIKRANYVLTDSFHGLVFSIIYKTDFIVFERFSNISKFNQNARVYNLLEMCDLKDRIYKENSYIDEYKKIDFKKVNGLINTRMVESRCFLFDSMEQIRKLKKGPGLNNIKNYISICCGCGACSSVCPYSAINMIRNRDGFFEASFDNDKCISCGRCLKVCPFLNNQHAKKIKQGILYSYKDKRVDVLMKSSSGGAGFALSQIGINTGNSVIGCVYDKESMEARHEMIRSEEELPKLAGSKYTQSRFFNVIDELKNKKNNMYIFGLPCQISAARLIHGDNATYIDLICHGVPTHLLLERYLEEISNKHGFNLNMDIYFRDKALGWKERAITVADGKLKKTISQHDDLYYLMFESCMCFSKTCYECIWRDKSCADIRLGDYWGPKFKNDKTGVSMVLSLNEKGDAIVQELSKTGDLINQDIQDIIKWQQTENKAEPLERKRILSELADEEKSLQSIVNRYAMPIEIRRRRDKKEKVIIDMAKYILKVFRRKKDES